MVLAAAGAGVALTSLELDTREDNLFSERLDFFERRAELYAALPSIADPVVIIIDSEPGIDPRPAARALAERLREDTLNFRAVHDTSGGAYFERNAWLYLEADTLETTLGRVQQLAPLLSHLAREPTLQNFFATLTAVDMESAQPVLDAARAALAGGVGGDAARATQDDVSAGPGSRLDWRALLDPFGAISREQALPDRAVLIAEANVDFAALSPAADALAALDAVLADTALADAPGIEVRVTGTFALAAEESELLGREAVALSLVSLALVACVLGVGVRAGFMVGAAIATLVVGLVVTTGIATLVVGQLNLISVAFGVLFIGLGIDFAIHYVVAVQSAGGETVRAAERVGPALLFCAATTAVAFFSYLPTDFVGVAELGAIAGLGMFVSLAASLTLLPALLVASRRAAVRAAPSPGPVSHVLAALERRPKRVIAVFALVLAWAAWHAPQLRFDANPLNVRDPGAASVQALDALLAQGDASVWNLNVLVPDEAAARALGARLEALPEVRAVTSLVSVMPASQATKRALVETRARAILPALGAAPNSVQPAPDVAALRALAERLAASERHRGLGADLYAYLARLPSDPSASARALGRLREHLLGDLPVAIGALRQSLSPTGVTQATLPADLAAQLVAVDGRLRVSVEPAGDLDDEPTLRAYVEAVQQVAPEAFGEAAVILESGRAVVDSMRFALLLSAGLCAAVLLVLWRRAVPVLLCAAPIGAAALLTLGGCVLFDIPLNFANVIAVPLVVGIGLDSCIHLVHRHVRDAPTGGLMASDTARAVGLSAATTTASFVALSFASHAGLASLGALLTLGIACVLLSAFVLLPALLQVIHLKNRPSD